MNRINPANRILIAILIAFVLALPVNTIGQSIATGEADSSQVTEPSGEQLDSGDSEEADQEHAENSNSTGQESDSQSSDNSTTSSTNSSASDSSGTNFGNVTEQTSEGDTVTNSTNGTDQTTVTNTNQTRNDIPSNSTNTANSGITNQTTSINNSTINNGFVNQTNSDKTQNSGNSTDTGSTPISNQTTVTNSTQTPMAEVVDITNSTQINENNATLSVLPPEYKISIDPKATIINAGASATFKITATSKNNFKSGVSIAIVSRPIPGIETDLSTEFVNPRPDIDGTSILKVKTDVTMASGTYKVKLITSDSSSNKTHTITLQVISQNKELEPMALSSVVIKDLEDNIVDNQIPSNTMVLISSTLNNNYPNDQPFVLIIEIRNKTSLATEYIQLQKGVLNGDGKFEVAISFVPDKVGVYEVRAFIVDRLKNPEFFSTIVGTTIEIIPGDNSSPPDYSSIERMLRR